jgi:hypothetical protein
MLSGLVQIYQVSAQDTLTKSPTKSIRTWLYLITVSIKFIQSEQSTNNKEHQRQTIYQIVNSQSICIPLTLITSVSRNSNQKRTQSTLEMVEKSNMIS